MFMESIEYSFANFRAEFRAFCIPTTFLVWCATVTVKSVESVADLSMEPIFIAPIKRVPCPSTCEYT